MPDGGFDVVKRLGIVTELVGGQVVARGLNDIGTAGGKAEQGFAKVGKSGAAAGAGIQSLRGPLSTLSAQLLGVNPAVATLTSMLGNIGLGAGVTVGAVAGIAALGFAYSKLTEETRKVTKAMDDSIESLRKVGEQTRAGLGGQLVIDIENVRKGIAELQKQLTEPIAFAKAVAGSPMTIAGLLSGGVSGIAGAIGSFVVGKSSQINAGNAAIETGEEALAQKFKQTTDAMMLQIARQTELNAAFGSGALAIDLINNKYEFANAVLKNSIGTTDKQRAELNGLAAAQMAAANTAAVFADNLRKASENTDLLAKIKALNEQVEKLGLSLSATSIKLTPGAPFFKLLSGGSTPLTGPQQIAADSAARGQGFLDNLTKGDTKRSLEEQLRLIDDAVRGAVQLGEAFGIVNRNVGDIVIGLSQIVTGIGPLNKALSAGGGFDVIAAALPVLGGLASVVSGFLAGADENKKAIEDFNRAQKEFVDGLTKFSNSFIDRYKQINEGQEKLIEQQIGLYIAGTRNPQDSDIRNIIAGGGGVSGAAAYGRQQVTADFIGDLYRQFSALNGPAGAFSNALNDIEAKYKENLETIKALGLGEAALTQAQDIRKRSIEQLITAEANAAGISENLLQRFSALTGATIGGGDPFASLRRAIADALAQGLTDLATALGQELRLDEIFKAQLDAMEEQKREADYVRQAHEAEQKILQQAVNILEDQLRTQQQTVDGLRQTVDTLRKYSDSLKLSNLTPLNPREQYLEAQRQYNRVAALAAGGDQVAVGQLPGFADEFLRQSRNMFASSRRYVEDYQQVQTFLEVLQGQYGDQLSTEERILAELQVQTDLAKSQLDASKQNDLGVLDMLQSQLTAFVSLNGGAYSQSAEANNRRAQLQYLSSYVGMGLPIADLLRNIFATPGFDPANWKWLTSGLPSYLLPKMAGGGSFRGMASIAENGPEVVVSGSGSVFNAAQWNAPVVDRLDHVARVLVRVEAALSRGNELGVARGKRAAWG